jgi:hypothetical protein
MTMMEQDGAFQAAFRELIGEEGGYVFNPADPGGETKYGITKRSYPSLNIKDLTLEMAKSRSTTVTSGCRLEIKRAWLSDSKSSISL